MHKLAIAALLGAAVAMTGCGDMPRAKVVGDIKYKGAPLTNATIMMLTKDNQVYRADLTANGRYELDGVPLGPVKVCIQQALPTVAPRPDPPPGARPDKEKQGEARDAKWVAPPTEDKGPRLPEKYGDPKQSGLSFELTKDSQDWSVDLQ